MSELSRDPIAPGGWLGLLGGGQLGRMFCHAAQSLGYKVAVLDPAADGPAAMVADRHIQAAYDDAAGLAALAELCPAVTTEFENVPAASLRMLSTRCRVSPAADAVAIVQERRISKVRRVTCAIGGSTRGGPFAKAAPPASLKWEMWQGQTPLVDYIPERCHKEFRWWYEYSGGKINYQLRGYYRENQHTITEYSYFLDDGVLLTTKRNFGNGNSGGIEFNFQGQLTSKLKALLNSNWSQDELNTGDRAC